MSAATGLIAAIVFGVGGTLLLDAERRELWSTMEEETRILTRSLEISVANALRDQQLSDVAHQLRALERLDPDADVFVYSLDGAEHTAAPPRTAIDERVRRGAAAAAARRPAGMLKAPDRYPGYFIAAAPLYDDEGGALGSLVVARPTHRIEEDLRTTRASVIAAVLAFIIAATVTSFALGELYVGRRLRRLTDALRRVGRGDYRVHLTSGAADEVGVVVEDFDRMAAQLSLARSELEARVEEKRRVERALQRADRLAAVGQLSAALAHEIGSPLQIIAGRARSLVDRPDGSERTKRNASILAKQADRIARTVEQLLAFARQNPLELRWIEPEPVVAEVIELVELEARRCGVNLRLASHRPLPRIFANPDQIQQVALNLVRNSLAATSASGSVVIRLASVARQGRTGLQMEVEDTGSGMPPEVVQQLFEPFFTTRLDEGGTGLGLVVVRSIVDEHGGTIKVESRESGGTRFSVWLPDVASGAEVRQKSG